MKLLPKLIFLLALVSSLCAQQPEKGNSEQTAKKDAANSSEPKLPDRFYRLSFAIYELEDGKRVNQRDYSMIGKTNNGPYPRISVTTRVPIYSEEKKMQYVDAGLTLSCSFLSEQPGARLQAHCEVTIGGFVRPDQLPESRSNGVPAPVLRNTTSSAWVLLTPGKPMLLTSIDDINSNKRMQVELIATRME
jgi:hypothetical protein